MSEPRRILYVRIDGCFGGVERHILSLLKHLNRSRYAPHMVPLVRDAELARRTRSLNIPVTLAPMPSRLALFSARRTLARIIQENHIDLVHTFGLRSNLVTGPLARRLGCPWVARVPNLNYTDYSDPIRGWFFHFLNNRLLAKADAVQVISTPLKEYMVSLRSAPARIELIPNGIDLPEPVEEETRRQARRLYALEEKQIVLGSLGRIERVKGYDLLLYSLAELPGHVTVLIGGEGSEKEYLLQRARVLGLAQRFRLVGFVENIRLFLAACDLYVQPSRSEGVPHALLEAMAMSLPVVASGVGGIKDIIRDGEDGILAPPGEYAALKERLIQLCKNDRMRMALGQRARQRVEQIGTAEAMTRRIEQLYDDLLA